MTHRDYTIIWVVGIGLMILSTGFRDYTTLALSIWGVGLFLCIVWWIKPFKIKD